MEIDFSVQISKILDEYQTTLKEDVEKAARKTARECAEDLNAASSIFPESGHTKTPYAQSWASKKDSAGGYTTYSKVPGLPHLLENGHVVVSHGKVCGYVAGKTHIKPVAEQAADTFEQRVKEAAQK